jgi:precorrin-2 dehydrogenase/sirohydrochlorin ferrochelatase
MARYHPILLDVRGRRCVVVGGGEVAYRKACALRDAGGKVTAVSPKFCGEFRRAKGLNLTKRRYASEALADAVLVVAATNSVRTNRQVAADATKLKALVNVVDEPKLCSFIVPATVTRGDLCIAISTGGASPALARRIREELEAQYGAEYEGFLRLLKRARRRVLVEQPAGRRRRALLQRLASSEVLDAVRQRGLAEARAAVNRILELGPPRSSTRLR